MSDSLLSGLNPEQLEAVTLPHQPALILAGAGSGKTRVLTTRIAWLIQSGRAHPLNLLAVTFTNKAAREMLTRITSMLPINPRGMWIGTFHGLCNRLLRAHYRDAGLPQSFQILDSADQLSAVKRLMKRLNIDDEKFPARQLVYFINGNKDAGLRASKIEASDDISRRMAEFYAAYDEQCNREGVVDFAELLLRSYELLASNASLRDHYRNRFSHILVDEFQDTSSLQYQWLKLLAGRDAAVFAVGDDDQSIYAFRGANVSNMHSFERDFSIGKVIKLEQNYRSHGAILDAANALISQNRGRLGKNLWTAEGRGEPLRLYQAASDFEEARFIVDEILNLRRDGVGLSDIALVYRSNAQSRVLEHALFNAALPYRVYGGLRFFERQEIKHALAWLRLIANPDDDNALLRVINFPPRGVGARSIEQLNDVASAKKSSLWRAALLESGIADGGDLGLGTGDSGSRKVNRGVAAFVGLVEGMRSACASLPLPEIIDHVVEASGLKTHYRNDREGADRLENLDELVNAATSFVREAGDVEDMLSSFLAHASLEAGEHQAGAGADALQLMTVHSAKGLEFHTVFISGLEEGLFPHENSALEPAGLEEERRLMYVALTRARRRLYLSFAQSRMLHGQTRYSYASRFLREIPEQLMQKLLAPALSFNPGPLRGGRETSGSFALPRQGEMRAAFRQPTAGSQWNIGQNVVHPKFGAGVIVNAEGRGSDARVQVSFYDAGVKWLALEYAKLSAA
ncbi:MAG: UvrD-helicase domain-containing protein [Burkholderiales bacterium]|nr:UvrD-helicase domain-containing protein [Pseudomonadota bacterium]